jgi:hypothetical protein
MGKVITCHYCGESYGNIKNLSTDTEHPLYAHVPACPSQRGYADQAREAVRDMSRNSDVKARWKW